MLAPTDSNKIVTIKKKNPTDSYKIVTIKKSVIKVYKEPQFLYPEF